MSTETPNISSPQVPAIDATPVATPEPTSAPSTQNLPQGIAERAAQLAAKSNTPEVPEVQKPKPKAEPTLPEQKDGNPTTESYASLHDMLGGELLAESVDARRVQGRPPPLGLILGNHLFPAAGISGNRKAG